MIYIENINNDLTFIIFLCIIKERKMFIIECLLLIIILFRVGVTLIKKTNINSNFGTNLAYKIITMYSVLISIFFYQSTISFILFVVSLIYFMLYSFFEKNANIISKIISIVGSMICIIIYLYCFLL